MFNFFKKKPKGKQVTFKIEGMHCVSCSMNIDVSLEEQEGIISSQTNFARALTQVEYDPDKTSPQKILTAIKKIGYLAELN